MSYKTVTIGENKKDYKIVCVNGHEYYQASFLYKMGIAIKLDDNGKPIKCR